MTKKAKPTPGGTPPFGWDAVDGKLRRNTTEQKVLRRARALRAKGMGTPRWPTR